MNIAELRKFVNTELDLTDDEAIIVVSGSDHSYYIPDLNIDFAEKHKSGELSEYFTDADMSEDSKKIKVLVVR